MYIHKYMYGKKNLYLHIFTLRRGPRILKPRGASAQAAAHSHLPRVWREAGMEGR
jgi:hypothetical protein